MTLVIARVILIIASAGAIATALVGLRAPEIVAGATPGRFGGAPALLTDTIDYSATLVRLADRTTPFRASRRVPMLRFGEQPTPPSPPPAAKPMLVLSGVVWGASPVAIIEGFPARDGSLVLRQGQSEGVFHVRRIERTEIEITGLDTTWVLKVREPWR